MDRILLIDTNPHFRALLGASLAGLGFQVETATTLAHASEIAKDNSYHLVLTASEPADADALSVIQWAQREQQAAAVMIVVPTDGVNQLRPALLLSDGFLFRSADDIDDPHRPVLQTLKQRRAILERDLLRKDREYRSLEGVLHSLDPAGKQLEEQLRGVTPESYSVLLQGESGNLFELLAREIHRGGPIAEGPFLSLASRASTAEIAEEELFGTEGPTLQIGRLEGAHGGTIFVEEISQLPLPTQDKLFRFLQTGVFLRRGGSQKVLSHTRLIAASTRNLAAKVVSGEFNGDLYLHLAAHPIEVPPLRARQLDILPLAEQFLSNAAARLGKSKPQFTEDSARTLVNYSWPGNLQELASVMERAALLSDHSVRVSDLMPDPAPSSKEASWREIERTAIEDALRATGGNRTKAARQLGMSLRKLQYRLREYGIRRLRPQN